ncbi:Pro-resilin-like 101, partial [Homarus americanus]
AASSPIVPTGSFQGPSEPHQPAVEFGSPDQAASSPIVPTGSFQGPSEPHQPAVEFGSSGEVDRAPDVPSGLYETPSAAVSSPDQPSPSLGTPSGIISGPPEPSSVFDTSVEQIHAVPVQPSSIVDTPDGSFSHPIELSKGSEGLSFPVPAAPSGLYEVPLIPGPETPTIFQPSHNMPIIFPGGAPGIIEGPSQAAPIPAQPSTLYGVPEVPSGLYETPKGRGKAMFLIDEVQSEPVKAQSLFYEASADANTPVLSVAQPMEGMPYDFSWGVEDSASGNLFTHRENSDGQSTNGQYRVTLPDGRVQVVTFYDNGDGFHTDISYE